MAFNGQLLVFIQTPYTPQPIGFRVKEGLIVDSDPKLYWAQGHSYLWFKEWLTRRRAYQRGWEIVREQDITDAPPIPGLPDDYPN